MQWTALWAGGLLTVLALAVLAGWRVLDGERGRHVIHRLQRLVNRR